MTVIIILMTLATSLPAQLVPLHVQDFEAAMEPWTHTNGQAFPYGWDRQPATLHPGWAPPNSGGWCLWIDSDATGEIGTSDFAVSPPIATTDYNPLRIRWGIVYEDFYNPGADYCLMQSRTHEGGNWGGWAAGKIYQADVQKTDSIALIGSCDSIQIRFFYTDGDVLPCAWAAIDNIEVTGFYTGVEGNPTGMPDQPCLILRPIRPNPVKDAATFSFDLSRAGPYSLMVYNISGQKIGKINGCGSSGHNEAVWNTKGAINGVYLYRLSTESGTAAGKLVVAR